MTGSFAGILLLSLLARAVGIRFGEPGEAVMLHLVTMGVGGAFISGTVGLLSARPLKAVSVGLASAHEDDGE
jgi:hypothetical protein